MFAQSTSDSTFTGLVLTQRVPSTLIEPIEELVKSMFHHVGCCAIIEPKSTEIKVIRGIIGEISGKRVFTYHGSNSWIMLSKRMTANSRDAKPAIQHISNTAKIIRDEMDPT